MEDLDSDDPPDYLIGIRNGVLTNPYVDGALDQVYRGEYALADLRATLIEAIESALTNIHKYLTQEKELYEDTKLITSSLQTDYLEQVLSELKKGEEVDIYGVKIDAMPAEVAEPKMVEVKQVQELVAA